MEHVTEWTDVRGGKKSKRSKGKRKQVNLSNSLVQVDSEENAVSCVMTLLKKIADGGCDKNTGVLITGLLEKMSKGDLKKVSSLLSSLIDEKLERQFDEKQESAHSGGAEETCSLTMDELLQFAARLGSMLLPSLSEGDISEALSENEVSSETWASLLFGETATKGSMPQPQEELEIKEAAESKVKKEDNQISSDELEEPPACVDEEHLTPDGKEGQALKKISLSGRTKEGMDNDRYEKKIAKKKIPVADGKFTIRKRRGQFLPKISKSRSIRKKYFKMMKKMKEEQAEKDRSTQNWTNESCEDDEPSQKETSPFNTSTKTSPFKSPNNIYCGQINTRKSQFRFSRKTGWPSKGRLAGGIAGSSMDAVNGKVGSDDKRSAYSEEDRCEIFVVEAYKKLDDQIRSTIAKAMDKEAVTSTLAGPAALAGGALGGGLSLATGGVPLTGAGSNAASRLVSFGEVRREHGIAKRVYQFFPKYEDRRMEEWLQLFVTVLTEFFINYNVVFCDLLQSPTDGIEKALHKIAKDIVFRIFSYLQNEKNIQDFNANLMVRAVLLGESEKGIKERIFKNEGGGEIKIDENITYKTGSFHSKCDVIFLQKEMVNKMPDSFSYRYSFEEEQELEGATSLSEYQLSEKDKFEELTAKKSQMIRRILEKLKGDPINETEPKRNEEKRKAETPYDRLLEKLRNMNKSEENVSELKKYFPFQLGIRDLTMEVDNTTKTLTAAPMRMLSTILRMNLEGRNCLEHLENITRKPDADKANEESSGARRRRRAEKKEINSLLSPQDLFMVAFQSCDPYLQQLLAEKMFHGKLALPFLLPSPTKENTSILTSWPLRSTMMEWKDREERSTTYKAKTVSVIRLGRPGLSKSSLLNEVISRDNQKIFFNRGCPQGGEKYDRILSNGAIEMSWFLPTGDKPDEIANDATRILNLRGDAMDFSNQVDYLAQISTLVVLVIEPSRVKEGLGVVEKLKRVNLQKSGCQVVNLWAREKGREDEDDILDAAIDTLETEDDDDLIEAEVEEQHSLISHLREKIRERLSNGDQKLSHEDIITRMKGFAEIEIDEDEEECRRGIEAGEKMIQHFKDKTIQDCKTEFLPLQTVQLWGEWSQLEKEKKRADYENRDEMSKRMNKIREEQAEKGASSFVRDFVNQLHTLKKSPQAMSVFLQVVRLHLDSLTHKCMPELRTRRKLLFNELRRKQETMDEVGSLEVLYEDLVKEIQSTSFGLEHIFREISQVYEAMHHKGQLDKDDYFGDRLPEAVANLIAHGISFEIMDGEASNIPRLWMKAVFKHLDSHPLLDGQKGHPISVCGVQSSGKSTLLNSMFGLNFSVSAGRCTRGVFMKIVPANKKEKEMGKIKYDFLLVIDTEGLNAPELLDDKKKEQRDNELATLAVGLGHITLINLKGENISEMKDILQIVILAFLRMKLGRSGENHNSKRSLNGCMFLHQNVSAVNAGQKMQEGLQKLQKTLDIATREVAETENELGIRTFTQVLDFDPDEHVLYFPSLWKGDPPMAPVNPGYSAKAGQTREVLDESLVRKEKPCLGFNQIFDNIDVLWRGILAENFVFNFKNNEYIKAYDSLEKRYRELILEVQEQMLDWRRKRMPEVEQQGNKKSLESKRNELEQSLAEEETQLRIKKKEAFEEFFTASNNQYSDILEKWKTPKLQEFDEKIKSIARVECRRLRKYVDTKILNCTVEENKKEYKEELATKAKNHAKNIYEQMKRNGHDLDEEDNNDAAKEERKRQATNKLREEFDGLWTRWMQELRVSPSTNDYHFRTRKAREHLREGLAGHELKALNDKLSEKDLDNRATKTKNKTLQDVQALTNNLKLDHFEVNQWHKKVEAYFRGKEHFLSRAAETLSLCLAKVLSYLEGFEKMSKEFDPHFMLHRLLNLCDLNNYCGNTHEPIQIKFTKEFRLLVIVRVFTHALKVFDQMQDRFEEKTSIKNQVEKEKEDFWNMFRSVFEKEDEEITLANMFVRILKPKMIATIGEYLEDQIFSLTIKTNSDKTQLLVKVLRDLVDSDWDKFQAYLRSPRQECRNWLLKNIQDEFFTAKDFGRTLYQDKARQRLLEISHQIRESICEARKQESIEGNSETNLAHWLDTFRLYEQLEVGFAENDFHTMVLSSNSKSIKDMDSFIRNVERELNDCEKEIRKHFDEEKTSIKNQVGKEKENSWSLWNMFRSVFKKDSVIALDRVCSFDEAFDEVWGCDEQCPFCGEFCRLGEKHEGKDHVCIQHRPAGMHGTWMINTGKLDSSNCSINIQRKNRFSCGFCKGRGLCKKGDCDEYHDYTKYKRYFPNWDIFPSSDGTEKCEFWAFMMWRHAEKLSKYYGRGFPDMPSSWETITPEKAKESLNDLST